MSTTSRPWRYTWPRMAAHPIAPSAPWWSSDPTRDAPLSSRPQVRAMASEEMKMARSAEAEHRKMALMDDNAYKKCAPPWTARPA